MMFKQRPFALSLSEAKLARSANGRPSFGTLGEVKVQGFDKLSPNGVGGMQ